VVRASIEHGGSRRLWSNQDSWYRLVWPSYARTAQSN